MKKNRQQFTVILADDEPSILNGLKNSVNWVELNLSIAGLARSGKQALQLILDLHPDLAIIDIRMPDFSGLEVIHNARAAGSDTDFVILSGYNDFSYAQEAIRYGAKSYLLKPLNKDELRNELFRILSERAQTRHSADSTAYEIDLPDSFFNDLVDGKSPDSDKISNLLLHSHASLSNSPCYCLVFQFEETAGSLPFSAMTEKMSAGFSSTGHKFWKYDEKKLTAVFNSSGITPFQTAMQCLEYLDAGDFPAPVIGVGDTVNSLAECAYSYGRALTALTYQLYENHSRIYTHEMICTVPPHLSLSDIDCQPLYQAILDRDQNGIQKYCDDFINSLLYVTMPPPNYVFSLCYGLFNLVESKVSAFTHKNIQGIANVKDLYQFRKLSQIRQWLADSFCRLSEYAGSSHENVREEANAPEQESEDEIIRTAKAYIHKNIQQQIKIEDIARQVHLSPSYFAIYFKNKTDVNLRDYLLSEKMEYAKQKLTNPRVPVSNVAYELGYGDYRSFSRAFKKFCGMTPSDYQNKRRQQHS